ncbi:MAG: sugar nucleotide-binding protein [Ruminococcus sp.]
MVQLSTDDVFDGLAQKPYTEFDNTNPKTVYGKSKCAGENYVKEFTHKHFIIRSNWVFGKGNNFVNRVLEAADQGRGSGCSGGSVWFPYKCQRSGKNYPASDPHQ